MIFSTILHATISFITTEEKIGVINLFSIELSNVIGRPEFRCWFFSLRSNFQSLEQREEYIQNIQLIH